MSRPPGSRHRTVAGGQGAGPAAPRGARAGFTLVELVAAMLLLTVGLLAIAGLAATAAQVTRRGGWQTLGAAVVQSRFDSLASLPCRTLSAPGQPVTAGTSTRRRVTERWVVLDGVNVKELIDTVRVPGRTTPLVHRSVLPCRD